MPGAGLSLLARLVMREGLFLSRFDNKQLAFSPAHFSLLKSEQKRQLGAEFDPWDKSGRICLT
jgi:hypothetical protein